MTPLRLRRRTIHQIGLPYHWESRGLATGDAVNELIAFVADPNVAIQESKALTADIQPGRRGRDRRVVTSGASMVSGRAEGPRAPRDLPQAQRSQEGSHGMRTVKTKEGEQA